MFNILWLAAALLLLSFSSQAKTPVKIAMYGDSTVWGSTTWPDGSWGQNPHNEPVTLGWLLAQALGEGKVVVENHGIGGINCGDLLYGKGLVKTKWDDEMASSDADIVTFNPAINDAFVPGLTDQDFIFCYSQLTAIAKNHGKTVVIMTPNPINNTHNATIWSLVNDERYVAQQEQVFIVDQWTTIMNTYPWQQHLPDNIHPDTDLYEYKASLSYQTIKPIVDWYIAH
jgi:hypothetical protein